MRRASRGGCAPGEGCTPGQLPGIHLTAQGPSRRPCTSPLLFALPCPVVHGCDAGPWLAALVEQLGHHSRKGACSSRTDRHCGRGAWRRPLTGKCQTWHTGLADRWPWPNQAPTGVHRKPPWASHERKGSSHCPVPQAKPAHQVGGQSPMLPPSAERKCELRETGCQHVKGEAGLELVEEGMCLCFMLYCLLSATKTNSK